MFLSLHARKGNAACGICGLIEKWKFIFQKYVLWTAKDPVQMPQDHSLLESTVCRLNLAFHAGKKK